MENVFEDSWDEKLFSSKLECTFFDKLSIVLSKLLELWIHPLFMVQWVLFSNLENRLNLEMLFVELSDFIESSSDQSGCSFKCESLDDTLLLSILISNLEFGLADAKIWASTKYWWNLDKWCDDFKQCPYKASFTSLDFENDMFAIIVH